MVPCIGSQRSITSTKEALTFVGWWCSWKVCVYSCIGVNSSVLCTLFPHMYVYTLIAWVYKLTLLLQITKGIL